MSTTVEDAPTIQPASCEPGHALAASEAARFPGLVAHVAHWQLLQSTRIKVELPEKAITRAGVEPPMWLTAIRSILDDEETHAEKLILAEWKTHPLRPWGRSVRGVGEHSLAVLVGLLDGDPYVAYPKERVGVKGKSAMIEIDPFVRSLSQLRSYCGMGDAERKRRAGMSQDEALACGKPLLKSRLRLIAESIVKAGVRTGEDGETRFAISPGGARYLELRAADREDWSPGHNHAHALRILAKEFLADLYNESERLHLSGEWRPA